MTVRMAGMVAVLALLAVPAASQTLSPTPERPWSAGAIGGLSAGTGDAGGSIGGTFDVDVTNSIAFQLRGLHADRGSGESGIEASGTILIALARTARAKPYVALGGGVYRAHFDLDDRRFFGMMNGEYAAGTQMVAIQGMPGYAMMGAGSTFHGNMWEAPWTGPMFTASQMPMFYANRLGQMRVPADGRWGARTFTDPALTFGGGLKLNLTSRFYVCPDLRGVVVLSSGDHTTLMTMNVGFGVRF